MENRFVSFRSCVRAVWLPRGIRKQKTMPTFSFSIFGAPKFSFPIVYIAYGVYTMLFPPPAPQTSYRALVMLIGMFPIKTLGKSQDTCFLRKIVARAHFAKVSEGCDNARGIGVIFLIESHLWQTHPNIDVHAFRDFAVSPLRLTSFFVALLPHGTPYNFKTVCEAILMCSNQRIR